VRQDCKILNHNTRLELGICKLTYKTTYYSIWKEWNITEYQNKFWALKNKKEKNHGKTQEEVERQLS
jgi:hypothetical protein